MISAIVISFPAIWLSSRAWYSWRTSKVSIRGGRAIRKEDNPTRFKVSLGVLFVGAFVTNVIFVDLLVKAIA